jgi:cytochrome c oxidase assembly protein subunit 15
MRWDPLPTARAVPLFARTALVLNMLLVVTGAGVRLSGSGLGCPTWPRCTGSSLVNTPVLGWHGYVEFGNRLLGVLLELVGIALVTAVLRLPRPRPRGWTALSAVQVAMVPLQALIGGLLVLTQLNPYVLILHFLVSFPLIVAAAALVSRVERPGPRTARGRPQLGLLTGAQAVTAGVVLVLGTLVTGTGPHAGSPDVPRLPFDPREITQLHADAVFLLCGLALALLLVGPALGATAGLRRISRWTVATIAVQAGLGYLQYFTGSPAALVAAHVLGATVVFTLAAGAHLSTTTPAAAAAVEGSGTQLIGPDTIGSGRSQVTGGNRRVTPTG